MADQQPHIVLTAHGEVDLDFALVPVTDSLVKDVVERVDGLKGLDGFVQAEFSSGAPVFFETPESQDLEDLVRQVRDEGYQIVTGRPDVHWSHFKRTYYIRLVLQLDRVGWAICWRACRESVTFQTSCLPVTIIAAFGNPYLKSGTEQFATLADGTPLYPAYDRLRPGERFRRTLSSWNGAVGEWVGVTLDGRLYRQTQCWGGEDPHPDKWQHFKLGGA